MTTSELKARMQSIINNEDFDFRQIALRAILADLEASELRKCPKCGNEDEPLQACDHCGHTWYTTSKLDRGIERAEPPKPTPEPPKPTGEQLKAIGKVLDGDKPRICKDGDYIFDGEDFIFNCHSQRGELRWHLKDAPTPQPALMICKYWKECNAKCGLKIPHPEVPACRRIRKMVYSTGCPFPDAVCVPWVRAQDEPEPVKHTSCEGCGNKRHTKPFDYETECSKTLQVCIDCYGWMNPNGLRKHYTPKEPEPAVPVTNWEYGEGGLKQKPAPSTVCESRTETGLICCKIIGGKGNELWIVDMPWGNSIALYKAVGRTDFAYIETEIGDKFLSMQAFDDPPVKAWFRETK